jgi:aldehyde dehydrogenase (NAD+)
VFIDGEWAEPGTSERIGVLDSATEQEAGRVPSISTAVLDRAVAAARGAQPGWAALSPAERAAHLARLHEELSQRAELAARLIAAEVGTPIKVARSVQLGLPLTVLKSYVDLLAEYEFEERVGNSRVLKEPVGVVGAISPWNYPLHQAMAKVAASLAGGNTVVLKPSSLAPLSLFLLADAAEAAGLPAGILNIVTGPGPTIGDALARHPGIDMVSFTGSTEAGVGVSQAAAAGVKRVALELGGKSASVILDDADLPKAVAGSVNNGLLNSGQTCAAWTRMIVPRSRVDEALEAAVSAARRLTLGDPFDTTTRLGPLVSEDQVRRTRDYVSGALQEGARAVVGGAERPDGFDRGFFCQPTILTDVTAAMRVAREEVFGPVLVVLEYDGEDEALAIANGTEYGLAGGVWSADQERATRFALRMRAGQIDINGGRFNALAPFGGFNRSGVGRELGRYGMEEFLEIKSLQF